MCFFAISALPEVQTEKLNEIKELACTDKTQR